MAIWSNRTVRTVVFVAGLGLMFADWVGADPVRITVHFTVAGATGSKGIADPDFGDKVATGQFSLVTEIPTGEGFRNIADFENGLGADQLSLSFAGHTWTPANADVTLLSFAWGQLAQWFVGGTFAGLCCSGMFPEPDILIASSDDFNYTTPRSGQLGLFKGTVVGWGSTVSPVTVTPEPMSLVLCATGLAAVCNRRRVRRG